MICFLSTISKAVKFGNSRSKTWNSDSNQRLMNTTTIQPTAVSYKYDAFGRRIAMIDTTWDMGNQDTVTYSYCDDLENIGTVTKSFAGGPQNQTVTYAYNPDGSRQSMQLPSNVVSFSEPPGNNYPFVNYFYDGVGRLLQADFPWTTGNWAHTYYANGLLNTTSNSALSCIYSYNARGQLSGLTHTTNGYSGPNYTSLTRDAAGNLLSEQATWPNVPSPFSREFTYDTNHGTASQNRDVLLTETAAPSNGNQFNEQWSDAYTYDTAFNIDQFAYCSDGLTGVQSNDNPLSFVYNSDNQFGSGSFVFDSAGNPETYEGAKLYFDAANRLVTVPVPVTDGASFRAQYDGDGHRSATWVMDSSGNSVKTYYIYDGDRPIVEESFTPAGNSTGAGTINALTGYAADGPRSRYTWANGAYSYVYDPQGNLAVRVLDGQNGLNLNDFALYEGYGSLRSDTDEYPGTASSPNTNLGNHVHLIPDPIGFGGQYGYYTDVASGLVLCTNRYYDPGTGRWLTRDPIGYAGGVNIYGFCGGNPVNKADPSGLTVTAVFDRGAGTLSIWDDEHPVDRIEIKDVQGSKAKALAWAVFSGETNCMNNPACEKVKGQGPIPAGQYLIGPLAYSKSMHQHFQLYGKGTDWKYLGPRNPWDHMIGRKFPGREAFNFHSGHISEGCVTVWSTTKEGQPDYPDSPTWERILALIRRAGTTADGYTDINGHLVPGNAGAGFIEGTYSGIMIVK